jgi:hypothetical protein
MRRTIIGFLSAAFLPVVAMGQTYNAVADWNPSSNTTANVWQYGTETTLGGTFSLFPYHNANTTPSYDLWDLDNSSNIVGPLIGFNSSGGTINAGGSPALLWPSGVLQIAPGGTLNSTPANTVLRWLAPSSGVLDITGQFSDLQQSGKESTLSMYVQSNGATIFTATYNGSAPHQPAVPFNLSNVSVTAGQDIDFIVQSGGDEGDDSLGITASVTESVPEPASLALGGFGSLLILRRRRA